MKSSWPKVTVAVIVYNEEKQIEDVLQSIFSQDYPKNKLEVMVVDDKSMDKTVEIARKFPVKILLNGSHDPEDSILIALKKCKGEYFVSIAGDARFRTNTWLKKMVKPLIENPEIAQAATRYYPHPKESIASRYLSLNPLQMDPIYRFFAPSIEKTIVGRKHGYFITNYKKNSIPPQCAGLYRTSIMKKYYRRERTWVDIDLLCVFVENGITTFAYVPDTGFYHFHVKGFADLIKKRLRNLNQIYLPNVKERKYIWSDLSEPGGKLKMVSWIIIANLFFPLFIKSIFPAIYKRNSLYLLDAPVALVLTDIYILNFLRNPRGRKFILKSFKIK